MIDQNGMQDQKVHEAAESGNLADLQSLISSNTSLINANGWFGFKPLHYAARSGSIECVKYLIKNGANINAKCVVNQTTALFEASTVDISRYLMEHGAQLDIISAQGRVPLDYAIQGKYVDVVNYLVHCGADVNLTTEKDFFYTLLQWAIDDLIPDEADYNKAEKASLKILQILLKAGANINQRNVYGTTVLHLAVRKNLLSIVELLLSYQADPCIHDCNGHSCFEYTDNKNILTLLEPYKANLIENIKVQDDIDTLIKRLLATGETTQKEFSPCSEQEIAALEKSHQVILPEEYKYFLRLMGNGAGSFLKNDHWDIFLPSFSHCLGKHFFKYKNQQQNNVSHIPESLFVFASRLGEYNLGFIADGTTDDPVIYQVDNEGNLSQIYDTLWAFFQAMVEYYEFYRGPSRFTQNN